MSTSAKYLPGFVPVSAALVFAHRLLKFEDPKLPALMLSVYVLGNFGQEYVQERSLKGILNNHLFSKANDFVPPQVSEFFKKYEDKNLFPLLFTASSCITAFVLMMFSPRMFQVATLASIFAIVIYGKSTQSNQSQQNEKGSFNTKNLFQIALFAAMFGLEIYGKDTKKFDTYFDAFYNIGLLIGFYEFTKTLTAAGSKCFTNMNAFLSLNASTQELNQILKEQQKTIEKLNLSIDIPDIDINDVESLLAAIQKNQELINQHFQSNQID